MIRETATLGGGCFWCLEAVYEQLQGVDRVVSGYAGGAKPSPTYEEVCSGATGHAEVVQITFDPAIVPYREILEVFFTIHDPTTPNRQGNDVGTQYRSIILTHSPAQDEAARALVKELADGNAFGAPIVTEIVPFTAFYRAEHGHQGYYRKNPLHPYCVAVVRPKILKMRAKWGQKLKPR